MNPKVDKCVMLRVCATGVNGQNGQNAAAAGVAGASGSPGSPGEGRCAHDVCTEAQLLQSRGVLQGFLTTAQCRAASVGLQQP